MKSAIKILALGAALAASATMAKADDLYIFNGGSGIINTANSTFQFSAAPTSVISEGPGATTFTSPLSFSSDYAVGDKYFYYENPLASQYTDVAFTMTDSDHNSMELVITSFTSVISGSPETLKISGDGTLYIDGTPENGTFTLSEVTGSSDSVTFTSSVGTTPTPEPSSLVLLGSGLLGAAGIARRRFGKHSA